MTAELAAQAEAWGYPRPISELEKTSGQWFVHELGIFWFHAPVPTGTEPPPGFDPAGVLVVHAIARPGAKNVIRAETLELLERLAREAGATKLYALHGYPVRNPSMRKIARYLRRYGWLEDDWGSYVLLGDG